MKRQSITAARSGRSLATAALCEFKTSRRVEFADTDMAGIMHFSNYFRFMETAETAFVRALGFSVELTKSGLSVCLPRVHAECDFFAPLRFEDEVLIHLLVERKQARSLTYQIRFYRQECDAPSQPVEVARGRVVAVCAARQRDGALKAVPLPARLAERIREAPHRLLHTMRNGHGKVTQAGPAAPVGNGMTKDA